MTAPRLSNSQIVVMRSLAQRSGTSRAVSLIEWQREQTVPLWRRGLIGIWYRQAPDTQPSLQGPFYDLTINGAYLASMLFPAPRGFSGAEQSK